jgi:hypothetical protein
MVASSDVQQKDASQFSEVRGTPRSAKGGKFVWHQTNRIANSCTGISPTRKRHIEQKGVVANFCLMRLDSLRLRIHYRLIKIADSLQAIDLTILTLKIVEVGRNAHTLSGCSKDELTGPKLAPMLVEMRAQPSCNVPNSPFAISVAI